MIQVLIAVVVVADGLAGLAGGLLSERWLRRHQPALAAGSFLYIGATDLLPEVHRADRGATLACAGPLRRHRVGGCDDLAAGRRRSP